MQGCNQCPSHQYHHPSHTVESLYTTIRSAGVVWLVTRRCLGDVYSTITIGRVNNSDTPSAANLGCAIVVRVRVRGFGV